MIILQFIQFEKGYPQELWHNEDSKTICLDDDHYGEWVTPSPSWLHRDADLVFVGCPNDPFTKKSVAEIRIALRKCLCENLLKVISTVKEGYLAVCYYGAGDDLVGYMHSLDPLVPTTDRVKNELPSWLKEPKPLTFT